MLLALAHPVRAFFGDTEVPAQCAGAQRRRLHQPLYGHDAQQLRLRSAGGSG
ncbi:hypothetical protein M8494_17820 [Serratia ureilytica]